MTRVALSPTPARLARTLLSLLAASALLAGCSGSGSGSGSGPDSPGGDPGDDAGVRADGSTSGPQGELSCMERFPEGFPLQDPASMGYVPVPGTNWPVYIDPVYLETPDPTLRASGQAATKGILAELEHLGGVFPPHALALFRHVNVYLDSRDAANVAASYFSIPPQIQTFQELAGYSEEGWRGAIVIFGANTWVVKRASAPGALVHELAHAYQDRFLCMGPGVSDLAARPFAAYDAAKAAGMYDDPERVECGTGVPYDAGAYAMTNVLEYFAETSMTFFVGGETSPCDRASLEALDPDGAEMVRKTWFVDGDWPDRSIDWRTDDPVVPPEVVDVDPTCGEVPGESSLLITCPNDGVIQEIAFASYGVPDGDCSGYGAGQCSDLELSRARVEDACAGRSWCRVDATNAFFGDPCPNWPKRLLVDWTCSDSCAEVNEGARMTLRCPPGSPISDVVFATYGRPSGDCAGYDVGECGDPTATAGRVEAACLGQASCEVDASNATFGDACPNQAKQLLVDWACADTCAEANQDRELALACPPGNVISAIEFARYGRPGGDCAGYDLGTCGDSDRTRMLVEEACLGRAECRVPAFGPLFDPCPNEVKRVLVDWDCAAP